MAFFDPMNLSSFNFNGVINYDEITFNKEFESESLLDEYQSIEFSPIFPTFPKEFSVFRAPTKSVSVEELTETKIDFRTPSTRRQYRLEVFDQKSQGTFFVNLEDIKNVSTGLYKTITTVTYGTNKKVYQIGQMGAGVKEFEIFLRIICNSYKGALRTEYLGKNMKRMIILAGRYGIPTLIEECKHVVRTANYSTIHPASVKRWYEGFAESQLDEFKYGSNDMVARPIRSHIISELIRYNRWNVLRRFVPESWLSVLYQRKLANQNLAAYDVDKYIHEHFGASETKNYYNSSQRSPI